MGVAFGHRNFVSQPSSFSGNKIADAIFIPAPALMDTAPAWGRLLQGRNAMCLQGIKKTSEHAMPHQKIPHQGVKRKT